MDKIWMKNWPAGIPETLEYRHGKKPIFEYLRIHAQNHPEKVSLESAYDNENELISLCFDSAETKERLKAFVEKSKRRR